MESSPLILVVDDSEELRELFQIALERAGYQVAVAANGIEGLAAVRSSRPDLIITDVSMPGMDGFDFLVHLRSDFSPPLPPVVVCSGFDVTAEKALRLGAVRFLAKPFDASALVRMVQQALSGKAADESALAHEQAFVHAAHERAAAAARRLFETLENEIPTLQRLTPVLAQSVSDYFGFGDAAILFVERGGVRIHGTSAGSLIPAGDVFSGQVLFATGVLAAGSSLVVTDTASFLATSLGGDPRLIHLGLNFLIAVPLVFDDTPVGSIILFDRDSHPFEAEDLIILEGIGRSASDGLRESGADLWIGYVQGALFDRMLGAELSILHRERGGLELMVVELEPETMTSNLQLELVKLGGPRIGLCRRDARTLAIYKRDANVVAARSAASTLLSRLVATGAVRGSGWVSVVDDGLPPVSHDVVLRLAGLALGQSRVRSEGRVERVVIGGERRPDPHCSGAGAG